MPLFRSILITFCLAVCISAVWSTKRQRGTGEGRRCKGGSTGTCTVSGTFTCPIGSACFRLKAGSDNGKCCKLFRRRRRAGSASRVRCLGGGMCGGYAGIECRTGFYCIMNMGTGGTCCRASGLIPSLPGPLFTAV